VSILSLIAIACLLLFGTSLIMRGVLPLTSKGLPNKDVEAILLEANTSTLEATSSIQPRETINQNNDSSRIETSHEGATSSNATSEQEYEIEIAKRNILEAWKVLFSMHGNDKQCVLDHAKLSSSNVCNRICGCQIAR